MNRKRLFFFWVLVWMLCWLPTAQADYYYHLYTHDNYGYWENGNKEGTSTVFPVDQAISFQGSAVAEVNNSPQSIGAYTSGQSSFWQESNADAYVVFTPGQSATAHVTFDYSLSAQGGTGNFGWSRTIYESGDSGYFNQYINLDPEHPLYFDLLVHGGIAGNIFSYYDSAASIQNLVLEFSEGPASPAPLPSTLLLVISGLAGVAWFKSKNPS
jgi:hypothetical protein